MEVVVNIVYPENSSRFVEAPDVPVGSASLEDGRYSLRWTIPELGGLEREVIEGVRMRVFDVDYDKREYPHELFGEVTTSSFESDLHQENNTDRIWFHSVSMGSPTIQTKGRYSITDVSVDEPNPSPGDIVYFTIAASIGINIDIEIAIELTDGLSVDEDSTAVPPREISYAYTPSAATAPSYSDSDGVITIGTRDEDERIHTLSSATLPVRVSSTAVADGQCLTATITGNPPPGAGPFNDDISDNVAKLCLGSAPVGTQAVFTSGTADLFTWYDCSEKTTGPCDSSIALELVALGETAATEADSPLRYISSGKRGWCMSPTQPAGPPVPTAIPPRWSGPQGLSKPAVTGPASSSATTPHSWTLKTTDDNDQWGVPDTTYATEQVGDLKVEVDGPGEVSTWYHSGTVPTSFYNSGTDETILRRRLVLGLQVRHLAGVRDPGNLHSQANHQSQV